MKEKTMKVIACETPSPYTGRIFPKEVLKKEVEKYQVSIDNNTAFGMLLSSEDDWSEKNILMEKGSHVIKKLWFEGNDLYANIELLLSTQRGKTASGLLDNNISCRLALNGYGNVDEKGVVSTFIIRSIDFVPSYSYSNPELILKQFNVKNINNHNVIEIGDNIC